MANLKSPQAMLPTYQPLAETIRPNVAQSVTINPPRVVTLTGNSDIVFDARLVNNAAGSDETNAGGFRDLKPVTRLTLHNLGTHAMYYAINQDAGSGDGQYHDVLAGGSVAFDGLGSMVDLSHDQPNYVSVKGTLGDKIAVVVAYPIGVNLA